MSQAAAAPDSAESSQPRRLRLPRTFAALRNTEYRLLWIGTLGSFLAMQMQMVARGYLAYELTGSAAALGIVSLARGLPQLVFTLVGGVVADRVQKRNLLLVTQSVTGLLALVTAMLVFTDRITIMQLVILGFVEGTVFAFNMPARQAFLPELVEQKDLMNAVALNNAGMNFASIFGPALAGLLITLPFVGLTRVFFFVAACYILPVFMLTRIHPRFEVAGKIKEPVLDEVRGGLRYIRQHDVLAMLLIVGLVPVLLGFSYQSMLPVFAGPKVLNVGASGLGLMSTFTGVGSLVGSLLIASYTNVRRRGLLQLTTGAAFGIALLLFALSQNFLVALVALLFVGFTASADRSLNMTLITAVTAREYYGRVLSVNMMGFSFMMLTPLPIGFAADHIGAPATMAILGGVIAIMVTAVGTLASSYRRLEVASPAEREREAAPTPRPSQA
jgi:predicted MFS family arabinose efflux permease